MILVKQYSQKDNITVTVAILLTFYQPAGSVCLSTAFPYGRSGVMAKCSKVVRLCRLSSLNYLFDLIKSARETSEIFDSVWNSAVMGIVRYCVLSISLDET